MVGARCAGAATAMLLAAAGHDVLLVDRAVFPSDTLSTHAIARSGVVQLNRWGLLQDVLDTGAVQQQRQEQPGRTGADDADLRAHPACYCFGLRNAVSAPTSACGPS